MVDPSFLGSGPAFPFSVDAGGSVRLRHGPEKVEESLRLILSTRPGERPLRPEFGCAAHEHVFAPVSSPRTTGKVVRAVEEALSRWEPRIELLSVTAREDRDGVLMVAVDYAIRASNDVRNLVHPFYAIPPEPTAPGDGGGV